MGVWRRRAAGLLVALSLLGCAHADRGRYGVTKIDVVGNEAADDPAIEACLITRERDHFGLTLGLSSPSCGQPPFDSSPPTLRLWRWPWTEWPTFNQAVFDQDVARVQRFYQARGYYDARVVDVKVAPAEAATPGKRGQCDPEHDTCPVSLTVTVEEGQPTRVSAIEVKGLGELPSKLSNEAPAALPLKVGDPIDETLYGRGNTELVKVLKHAGYAGALSQGQVDVDTKRRSARVSYTVAPGPLYRFGKLSLKGQGELPEDVIKKAAGVRTGDRYSPDALADAQAEVLAMRGFSAVEVNEQLNPEERTVDIELELTRLSPHALRLVVGVMSGAQQRTATSELQSIPQWDIHVGASYERRHLFDTLMIARVEERPRLIFNKEFPRPAPPQLGNLVKLTLDYPGLLEARTNSFFESAWDYGPEPFLSFIRSDILFRVGAQRGFFRRRLAATLAVQQDLFLVAPGADNVSSDGQPQNSYGLSFLEQDLRLDFRDNRVRPRRGFYLGVHAAEAVRWAGSDWTAFFLTPEARSFVPLFWDIVWATRGNLSSIFVTSASDRLDPVAAKLGPTTYRLRGGGANSNRGFLAGQLGAGYTGGIRRWELGTELRVPLGASFVLGGFFDLGDVNDEPSFRFGHLNASAGYGFRYYTILGAIRLDFGFRIPRLQRADGSDEIEPDAETLPLLNVPGAIHLTIGDAF